MPTTTGSSSDGGVALRPVTWGWVLKRAALGVVILAFAMGSVAWLTYASLEPEAQARGPASKAGKAPQGTAATPIRL